MPVSLAMAPPPGLEKAARLAEYLTQLFAERTEVVCPARARWGEGGGGSQGFGYGVPFEVECRVGGHRRVRWRAAPGRPRASATTIRPTAPGRPSTGTAPTPRFPAPRPQPRRSGSYVRAEDGVGRRRRRLLMNSWRRPRPASTGSTSTGCCTTGRSIRSKSSACGRWPGSSPRSTARSGTSRTGTPAVSASWWVMGNVMGILDSYPHPWPTLPPETCRRRARSAVALASARARPSTVTNAWRLRPG